MNEPNIHDLEKKINTCLAQYADKDWNYSRIRVQPLFLEEVKCQYVLWFELIDPTTKQGRSDLQLVQKEVVWGDHHSNELGILELISLRLNKALLAVSNDSFWDRQRPILRLAKRDDLQAQGVSVALWYEVQEIAGEDFDSR